MNSHTTNISTYVDYHLQPIVKEIPSYVKYTRFSKEFRESKRYTRSKHSSYIRHSYTNIPNNKGIKAVKESMRNAKKSNWYLQKV